MIKYAAKVKILLKYS